MHDLESAYSEYVQAFKSYKSSWNLYSETDLGTDLAEKFMDSLRHDIADTLQGAQLETFSRCLLRMIDIGASDAIVTDRGIDGVRLPGFLILSNIGLYFLFKLLVTAQILEDLRGDYEKYNRSGADVFNAAFHLYATESPEKIFAGSGSLGNTEVDDDISTHVSLGSVLLMQFVVLHEIGHAHLGHAKLLKESRNSALTSAGILSEKGDLSIDHQLEYEADAFAWQALSRRANDSLENFGNIYVIRLYFAFLERIEITIGKPICEFHPSPQLRFERLMAQFSPNELTVEQKKAFERQDMILDKWLMKALGEKI